VRAQDLPPLERTLAAVEERFGRYPSMIVSAMLWSYFIGYRRPPPASNGR